MAVSVEEIFRCVGINRYESTTWDRMLSSPISAPAGIYVIELAQLLPALTLNSATLEAWMLKSGRVTLNGQAATLNLLQTELASYWKADESVLYIGQSDRLTGGLKRRLKEFYEHSPGNKGPHSGGYWIKLLDNISSLNVHYAECENSHEKEFKMLMYFALKHSSKQSIFEIENIGQHLPFANLTANIYKTHSIGGAIKG